ncbi:MAG TPA: acyltransferase family protein, partial [Acidimicrobiales bacterium]|nr:acyltransferase family protein [Acidimicrobiales bacterium]
FYARRARRILPAATVVVAATVICSRIVLTPDAARRSLTDAVAAVFYAANYRFAIEGASYFNSTLPPSPLLHFWSLAVEEQFYLIWPLLLVVASLVWVGRRRRDAATARRAPALWLVAAALGALAVLSFVISVLQETSSPSWDYYSILTRGWELAAGSLAALALPRAARLHRRAAACLSWVGLGAIALAATVFNASTPYPGTAALVPVAGALAVVVGGSVTTTRRGASLVLGTRPFQMLGAWSYSLYLWHWPVLLLGSAIVGHPLSQPELVLAVAVSLGLAVCSYKLVEQPILRIQIVVRRPRLGIVGAVGLLTTSLLVVTTATLSLPVLAATGAPAHPALSPGGTLTSAQLTADLESGSATTAVPSNLTPALSSAANARPLIVENGCHLQRSGAKSLPCVYGDTSSETTVVLFGDSHAAAWFPALQIIAEQQGWRLLDFSKSGCPPVEVAIAGYPQCTTWRDNTMAQIASLHPDLVVVTWARYLEEPEAEPLAGVPTGNGGTWDSGVAAVFSFLEHNSDEVLFLSDTPTMAEDVPDCVSGHLADVEPCTTPAAAATLLPAVKAQEIALAEHDGVHVVDPTNWFCGPSRCPVIVGNIILYRDDSHMTPAYSAFIEPVVSKALTPILAGRSRD